MRPTLYTVHRDGPGRLSTMARPRGDDWLDDELRALRCAGVDVLVCALPDPELQEVGLAGEGTAAGRAGLEFVAIPIRDRSVPDLDTVCHGSVSWSSGSTLAGMSYPLPIWHRACLAAGSGAAGPGRGQP